MRLILCIIFLMFSSFALLAQGISSSAELSKTAPSLRSIKSKFYTLWEAEKFLGNTGVIVSDKDASKGKAIFADVDITTLGSISHGQYASLPQGNYFALFRLKLENVYSTDPVATIDVAANGGTKILGEVTLKSEDFNGKKYIIYPVFFKAEDGDINIEARVSWLGNSKLYADFAEIYSVSGDIPANKEYIKKRVPQVQSTGFPNNLTYNKTEYPDGNIFPVSNQISDNLTVCNLRGISGEVILALVTLQGLVNRDNPKLYYILHEEDQRWIDNLKSKGYIKNYTIEENPLNLFKIYKDYYKGAVVTDPLIPASVNVATMYAGVENTIVCGGTLAKNLGIKIIFDTRFKWKTNVEAYQWAMDNLFDKLNHYVSACIWTGAYNTRDYYVQHKVPLFWIPGELDTAYAYSNALEEMKIAELLLSKLPPNTPVMGYPWAGHGVGIGEHGGVGLLAEFGHFIVPNDNTSNLSVHSGVRIKGKLIQENKEKPIKLDRSKKYVVFTISDGDNVLALSAGNWPQLWQSNSRGKVPVTWNVSPSSCLLIPDIMEYYYETASPKDTFGVAVSGIGYTYPALYGIRFRNEDKPKVFDGFVDLTSQYMKRMDLKVIAPMNAGKREMALFANKIDGLIGEFPDYGRQMTDYNETVYLTDNNIPVLHAGSTYDEKLTDPKAIAMRQVEEIKAFMPKEAPGFMHVFICNWFYTVDILEDIQNTLGDDYVVVSAENMADLIKQYYEEEKIVIKIPPVISIINGISNEIDLSLQNAASDNMDIVVKAVSGFEKIIETKLNLESGKPTVCSLSGNINSSDIKIEITGDFGKKEFNIKVNSIDKADLPDNLQNTNLTSVKFFEAESTNGNSGEIVEDISASGGKARASYYGKDNIGHTVYGPYYPIDSGNYVAVFKIKRIDDLGEDNPLGLDIAPGGQQPVAAKEVKKSELPIGEYKNIFLPFKYPGGNVETRVLWNGGPSVAIDSVSIFRID